jgi:hypothetical protein
MTKAAAKTATTASEPAIKPARTHVGGVAWKVVSAASTLLAAKAATTIATKGWSAVTGRPVPKKSNWDKANTRDIVAYSAISAALLTGAKAAAERKAAEYYRQSAGHLPSSLTEPKLSRKEKKALAKAAKKP